MVNLHLKLTLLLLTERTNINTLTYLRMNRQQYGLVYSSALHLVASSFLILFVSVFVPL